MTTPTDFPVHLTPAATAKVRSIIADENLTAMSLRMAVRPGGCSGFSYEMFFDGDITSHDLTAVVDGVPVVVDPSSAVLLAGATLDWRAGLQGGFLFTNPNAQRTCGCGSSFS